MRLIDTEICSYAIRRKPQVLQRLFELNPGAWAISAITQHELRYGMLRKRSDASLQSDIEAFLLCANVVDFGSKAADAAAGIRADLTARGLTIGSLDPLIAGHAISLNATLVTNNTKHFERIDGLKLESWVA